MEPKPGATLKPKRERRTLVVLDEEKRRNLARLARIEGQVRGVRKMVAEDRYCADILTQIASVHEALRGVGKELMRHHLRHCATQAIRGTPAEADAMYDELLHLIYTRTR
ncbi:MAG: metal-sensitive transcriptional regulator [Gemmatimonadetes bacterium]|nr:metal-sensitive transcriptional regulator [Gemmatimonadota bacterium]